MNREWNKLSPWENCYTVIANAYRLFTLLRSSCLYSYTVLFRCSRGQPPPWHTLPLIIWPGIDTLKGIPWHSFKCHLRHFQPVTPWSSRLSFDEAVPSSRHIPYCVTVSLTLTMQTTRPKCNKFGKKMSTFWNSGMHFS